VPVVNPAVRHVELSNTRRYDSATCLTLSADTV